MKFSEPGNYTLPSKTVLEGEQVRRNSYDSIVFVCLRVRTVCREVQAIMKKKLMRHHAKLSLNWSMMHHVLSKIVKREITRCGRAHPNPAQTTTPVKSTAHQTLLLFIAYCTT